ncbi:DUF983 domain-containing protein [Zavarzinia compransoris]|uniref:DUF983 domain-containing protein n=1 Tax=Zavarzinia compransoris TaxID=1264899 RepID=A0A317DZ91_9PROT|nr:DUF983 domain-containing protein [Zavarzinia compransoris]PWR19742.1 hypothetical protein DKG75_14865 [Zavarzinia compransoris]TDP43306.1 uncharacterized protein (DUF983 family) [Zavarzinia compransoris]
MPIEIKTGPRPDTPAEPRREWQRAVKRGARLRCPACGEGRMFNGFLKVNDACPHCGQALNLHKADDAPPYFTITIVAHIVVPLLLFVEQTYAPAEWLHAVIWLPLSLVLSLLILPRVKGALIGLQWAFRMHGFGAEEDGPVPEPAPKATRAA